MRKGLFAILLTAILVLSASYEALADISISALTDKSEISMDEVIYLSVSVEGVSSTDTIPNVDWADNFNISYRGASSRISMVNGVISSNVDFNFVLEPKREGAFSLPSITFVHEGEVYRTEQPIRLTVKKTAERKAGSDVFVKAEVSNSSPYVNEQIIFTFKFYTSVQISNPVYNAPDFSNFIFEDLGAVNSYQESVGGKNYVVSEIKTSLFPQRSGECIIPLAMVRVDVLTQKSNRGRSSMFGMFEEYQPQRLQTEEIKFNVKPLPTYDNKDIPFSNLVGDFKVDSSLGKSSLNVNDSTTLTVTVQGYGNLKAGSVAAQFGLCGF